MDEQIKALLFISSGTCDDDYDEEGDLVFTSKIMVTTVDYDGNTIGNDNQLDKSYSNSDHASHLVGDIISISDIFLIPIVLDLAILAIHQIFHIGILMRQAPTHSLVGDNVRTASITRHPHPHHTVHVPISTKNDSMEFTFISMMIVMMFLLQGFRFQLMMIVLMLEMFKSDYTTQ